MTKIVQETIIAKAVTKTTGLLSAAMEADEGCVSSIAEKRVNGWLLASDCQVSEKERKEESE